MINLIELLFEVGAQFEHQDMKSYTKYIISEKQFSFLSQKHSLNAQISVHISAILFNKR